MGLIRKVASIMMLGGVSSYTRHEPPGKAERARTKAERAGEEAAQAQAVRAEAEAKVAKEQAAALARALHEDGPCVVVSNHRCGGATIPERTSGT